MSDHELNAPPLLAARMPELASRATGARYRLASGLTLQPGESGGVLLSRRPLMAVKLNGQGFALLRALTPDGVMAEACAKAAHVSSNEATSFLDRLAQRRLVVRTPAEPVHWPCVSIIVAARGRREATRACVQSLLALDYPAELREIIVVDDASDPPLAPALQEFPIRVLRLDDNVGQSAARNLGATAATGDILAFTDNDCVVEPGWLRALAVHFDKPDVGIIGGRVIAAVEDGAVAAFESVRSPLDMGANASAVGPDEPVAYLPTCNLLVRRDLLLALGGFSAGMRVGEDVDFCWRASQAGARARYVPDGRIIHDHRVRLGALLRRRADYGASEADLQQRHPAQRRVMHIPVLGVLALAALTALCLSWPLAATLAALVSVLAAVEVVRKHASLRRLGVEMPRAQVAGAVLREHLASLHGLSGNVLRYYGVLLAVIAALLPALLPATAVLLLLAPAMDHGRLKPRLSLPTFVGLSLLEMAAYQWGVWRGCVHRQSFHPLLPRLILRR